MGRRRSNQETEDIKPTKALKKHENKARDNQPTTRPEKPRNLHQRTRNPKPEKLL